MSFTLGLLILLWRALARLPAAWLEGLAAAGAWLQMRGSPRQLRRLCLNVERVYALPQHSYFAQLFAGQVFRQQILIALETLRAIRRPASLTVLGFAELSTLVAKAESAGRGHILVTAHVGSWELCAYYAQKAATQPLHVLAKPSRSTLVTAFLALVRERMGTHVLWTDKKTLLRDMLGALRRGEALGFVMDQKPEGRKGPLVPFLGVPTEFVSGPESMARKTGCPVIAIFCMREGLLTYRLVAELLFADGGSGLPEGAVTAACAAAIEGIIRAYPEQWTWTYKRWRETIGAT